MVEKLEVLIAEDTREELEAARNVSKDFQNVEFSFARTLAEARQFFSQKNYDLILTDGHFPADCGESPSGESGFAIVQYALQNRIPYFVVSNIHHHRDHEKGFWGLYNDFLRKENEAHGIDTGECRPNELLHPFVKPEFPFFGLGGLVIEGPYKQSLTDRKPWKSAIIAGILLAKSKEESMEIRKRRVQLLIGEDGLMSDEGRYIRDPDGKMIRHYLTIDDEKVLLKYLRQ